MSSKGNLDDQGGSRQSITTDPNIPPDTTSAIRESNYSEGLARYIQEAAEQLASYRLRELLSTSRSQAQNGSLSQENRFSQIPPMQNVQLPPQSVAHNLLALQLLSPLQDSNFGATADGGKNLDNVRDNISSTSTSSSSILSAVSHVPQEITKYRQKSVADSKVRDPSPDSSENVANCFPEKLYRLLLDSEADGNQDIISFLEHGRAFIIHNSKRFEKEIMARYFRHSNFSSFQRQLNFYGFRRINRGKDSGAYYHEKFLRGNHKLCAEMKRTKVKGAKRGHPGFKNDVPNFYAMPSVEAMLSVDGMKSEASSESDDKSAETASESSSSQVFSPASLISENSSQCASLPSASGISKMAASSAPISSMEGLLSSPQQNTNGSPNSANFNSANFDLRQCIPRNFSPSVPGEPSPSGSELNRILLLKNLLSKLSDTN
mmetsp:Transcript_45778/g.89451  ORF Transcript_45778/g.89451 Transcript_45778/m.89451 type:complete len:434 (-) Transcript_45778:284-1585(-)